jgi:ATP/maltotriose-dependent transcriptional regulator MalT
MAVVLTGRNAPRHEPGHRRPSDDHRVLARALLAARDARTTDAAAAALDRALALTDETGAVSVEPFIRVQLAELARARGDEAAHAHELSEARRLFDAIGAPKRAAQLAAGCDRA